jgi:post-segregation antitoxin (ccd killing protein)
MMVMTKVMTRAKISATVDRELLERAKALTGVSSISELLDRALAASVSEVLESRWHAGYESMPAGSAEGDIQQVSYGALDLD